jgi:hypothetical protein
MPDFGQDETKSCATRSRTDPKSEHARLLIILNLGNPGFGMKVAESAIHGDLVDLKMKLIIQYPAQAAFAPQYR